jgi:hypothetical protein
MEVGDARPHDRPVHLLQSGVELNVIKSWLGHVSITTTSEYIQIDMAMKRKAIERCARPAPARKVKATGTPAKTSSNGSKTSELPKVMLSSVQSAILLPPADPRLTD